MKKRNILSLSILLVAAIACNKKDDSGSGNNNTSLSCTGVAATFAANASPVIVSKCATGSGCHGSGATNSGGVLTTHAQISAKKDAIKASVVNGSMPKNSTLTTAEKQAIVCWIDAGALNN
jgi:uncharacterized membrane protein